jgi:acetyltransferase
MGMGIPLAPTLLAETPEEARATAEKLGYPVAVKIESPGILHKTEAGGVRLGLMNADNVETATQEILTAAKAYNPAAFISGVVIQRMAKPATELVLGLRRDPVFGPVIMVGLGGIFVEILEDVAFAAAPVTPPQAEAMLSRLQGAAILDGARGKQAVNRKALVEMICNLSNFALAHTEIAELDLNPIFADDKGVVAVDWVLIEDAKN